MFTIKSLISMSQFNVKDENLISLLIFSAFIIFLGLYFFIKFKLTSLKNMLNIKTIYSHN